MRLIIPSVLFILSATARISYAEDIGLYVSGENISNGGVIIVRAAGFTPGRYKIRPMSPSYILEIYSDSQDTPVGSESYWSEMPYLENSVRVKVCNESPGTGTMYFKILDIDSNKVYESTSVVFYSEADTVSLTESYTDSVVGLGELSSAIGKTGDSPSEKPTDLELGSQGRKATEHNLSTTNVPVLLVGVLAGVVTLVVSLKREKNAFLNDKIH